MSELTKITADHLRQGLDSTHSCLWSVSALPHQNSECSNRRECSLINFSGCKRRRCADTGRRPEQ